MVGPSLLAAEQLAVEGIDCAVVNCRFLKPMDHGMLQVLATQHRTLVTVEEGTIVNGFGAALCETLQTTNPEVRVLALGVCRQADRTGAPRRPVGDLRADRRRDRPSPQGASQ